MKYIKLFEAKVYDYICYVILEKLGIKKDNVKKLGSGDEGIAFLYDGKVYKITNDCSEVELAYILLGKKLEHYVEIYDIFCYDSGLGEDNRNIESWKPRFYWVIVEEFVETGGGDNSYYDALRYFDDYVDDKKFKYNIKNLNKILNDYLKEANYEEDEIFYYLNIIIEFHLELQKYGIKYALDLKSSNLGYRDVDFKYFDLRMGDGIRKDINSIKKL